MATQVDELETRTNRRGRGRIIAVVALLTLAGLAAVAYFGFIRTGSPDRLTLSQDPAPGAQPPAAAPAPGVAGGPQGRWTVDAAGSTVGYRVRETFAGVAAPVDAVGRTGAVDGEVTIAGSTMQAARVTADLSQLKSDRDRRDQFLKTRSLETDRFPRATFTLTRPVDLGPNLRQGEPVRVTAPGTLELHGVTKPVELPLEGRWDGDTVEVVGNTPVSFADYGIGSPSVAGVVSVEDRGEVELKLVLRRA